MSDERTVWKVTAIIEATADQAQESAEAIERALCPDESHPGYCPVPWTTIVYRFEELTDEERTRWQADFHEERMRARETGEPGA